MMRAEWLPILMQGSFSEIYVMDSVSLRLLHANQTALENLQYAIYDLTAMTMSELAQGMSRKAFDEILMPLHAGRASRITLETMHTRKDGSTYPVELHLFHCLSGVTPVFIAIGNDVSTHNASANAPQASEARFRAIVSNTPGLTYQLRLNPDGKVSFLYVSEACHALLGITPASLQADPSRFLNLILPEDRQSYLDAMRISAVAMTTWNWEGRIWIEQWKDIKWINLRSTPRILADDAILWEGIMTNITHSKLQESELKHSRTQLAELSAHIDIVKDKERTRIAREIHDDIGSNLTAIKMAMAQIKKRLPSEDSTFAEKVTYVDVLVDRIIESIHRISADLRPSMLDFGIAAAIEAQTKEFEKQLGIRCAFSSSANELQLSVDQTTGLFRIFQEALTNISKHAKASHVTVQLVHDSRTVRLEIIDNGHGIETQNYLKPKSFGIRGMIERANALGGHLTVSGTTGGGTEVIVEIPIAQSWEVTQ